MRGLMRPSDKYERDKRMTHNRKPCNRYILPPIEHNHFHCFECGYSLQDHYGDLTLAEYTALQIAIDEFHIALDAEGMNFNLGPVHEAFVTAAKALIIEGRPHPRN